MTSPAPTPARDGGRAVRFVGSGRAAGAFSFALTRAGWTVHPPLGRADDLSAAGEGVDLVVLAVPDDRIAEVASQVGTTDAVVAHLAGSLGLDVLSPHLHRAAVHPLVALPSPEVGAERLVGGWFAVAGHPMADEVVAALAGRSFVVADADRPAYHAAACIASNHLVGLLGQVERVAAGVGVPLEAYLDLVRGTVENVASLGPRAAITGPASRGDQATLDRHRQALESSEVAAYDEMVRLVERLVVSADGSPRAAGPRGQGEDPSRAGDPGR